MPNNDVMHARQESFPSSSLSLLQDDTIKQRQPPRFNPASFSNLSETRSSLHSCCQSPSFTPPLPDSKGQSQTNTDRLLPPGSDKAKPRTQLMLISRSKPGIDFLRSKAAELRSASGSGDPDALADLGSVLLLLGDSSQAVLALEKAVATEGRG